jgi:pimeloyl-ACP methyl ester carboxylesterase
MPLEAYPVTLRRLLLVVLCCCGLASTAGAAEIEYRTVIGFGGVPLAVAEAGNRSGPAILFVHGSSQAIPVWEKQFSDPTLSATFHLIAFDLRGHGASGKPWEAEAYSLDSFAGDVKAVIEATTAGRVVLVPWSYGGSVAFAYVRKFGLARVAAINIAASRSAFGPSSLRAEMSTAERTALEKRSAAMRSDDLEVNAAATRDFIGDLMATPLGESEMATFFTFNMMTPAYVRRVMRSFRPDNKDLAPQLKLPVLVSHGDADSLVLLKDAQRTHRMIAGSRLSIYEGVGHMPFYERPERFNHELAEFVASVQDSK